MRRRAAVRAGQVAAAGYRPCDDLGRLEAGARLIGLGSGTCAGVSLSSRAYSCATLEAFQLFHAVETTGYSITNNPTTTITAGRTMSH